MKRNMITVLAVSLSILAAGCSAPEAQEETAATTTDYYDEDIGTGKSPASFPVADSSFRFTANGCTVGINMETSQFIDGLGNPEKYFESESCAFEGLDKVYTYHDYVIRTYPVGDKDYVSAIELRNDVVTTSEGAYIGMTADEVKALYPSETPNGDSDVLYYVNGDTKLSFILSDGEVSAITYTAKD